MVNDPIDPQKNDAACNANEDEESFAELFESYLPAKSNDIRTGQQVSGRIIEVGDENVFVDIGSKIDGVVDKQELIGDDGVFPYAVGDKLTLYAVSADEHEIRLSKAITGSGGLFRIYDAFKSGIPVEGRVLETCKGGFKVDILGKTAFCPISQMDVSYVENGEDYVGMTLEFLVTRIEEKGRNIVVSRRELLNRQIAEAREKFLSTLREGDIIEGKVIKIMPFGAFVSLAPGVEGMVHISELGWSRADSVEDIVKINDRVEVKVLSIGEKTEDKNRGPKISLSIKQAQKDPWDTIKERFLPGDKVTGRVTRCADFGAFVEIAPGLEGLVHISEMSYRRRIVRPEDVVEPGREVSVMIKSIDTENRRISLSMKDAEGDPWINVTSTYPVGRELNGIIEKKETFGYFITLEPGVTGLLPASKIHESPNAREIESLKPGDAVAVRIIAVDTTQRKITLSPADGMDSREWENFSGKTAKPSSLGTLGEKLAAAMKKK